MKIFNKILRLIRAILFLPFWWLQRLIPRNKKIFVFGAWGGNRYFDNSKALFEYILNCRPDIKPYWITKNKKIYQKLTNENKTVVMAYSFKGWWICLRASVAFIVNGIYDINKYASHGIKQIWLWHGMPLKKIRFDNKKSLYYNRDNSVIKKIKRVIINYLLPYDYYKDKISATVSSGDFFIPVLMTAFSLKTKNVWLTGLPRTDYLYSKTIEKKICNLRTQFIDSRIVLYIPTYRSKIEPYNPFEEKSFNARLFLDFLKKENIVFLYKPHMFDWKFDFSLVSERFVILCDNDYDELYVLISNIDILITDYSSVYFDYLCLYKPAILTPFDYEAYIKKSREHYFDYNLLPSIKAYNWDELMTIITEKRYYKLSKEETDKFCKYNDGHTCEKVLQKTFELLAEKS